MFWLTLTREPDFLSVSSRVSVSLHQRFLGDRNAGRRSGTVWRGSTCQISYLVLKVLVVFLKSGNLALEIAQCLFENLGLPVQGGNVGSA